MSNNNDFYGGAFQLARKLFSSEIWLNKPSSWKIIWIYILGKVNHQDNGKFMRGEGFFNFSQEIKAIGNDITPDIIKKFTKYARESSMIRTTRSTRGVVIKVLNYDKYQSLDNFRSTKQGTSKALEKHYRSTTINNNVNNDNNVNNIESGAEAPTPSQIMTKFINEPEEQEKVILALEGRGMARETSSAEIKKFLNYWCELTKSGKQQRWQTEKTFELQRRLATWFNNAQKFNKTNIIKSL